MTIADAPSKPQPPRRARIAAPSPNCSRRWKKSPRSSPNLVANHDARFEFDGESYELPRYLFVGPRGGDTPIRVGIFAGIHGDEPEGVHAIVQFIKLLEAKPELAAGYYLSFYPVCNPTGFEDGTRHSRARQGFEPRVLEKFRRAGSPAVAGRTRFAFVPGNHFAAHRRHERRLLRLRPRRDADEASHRAGACGGGKISRRATSGRSLTASPRATASFATSYDGILSAPPKVRPRPFEIILKRPPRRRNI